MRSVIASLQSSSPAKQTARVVKSTVTNAKRPTRHLSSLDEYFWYTSSDGVARLATSSDTLSEIPRQIHDCDFNPAVFAHDEYPSTFPTGAAWPPKTPQDLFLAIGEEGDQCVGDRCYTDTVCVNARCTHSFEAWKSSVQDWQNHFQLRKTLDRSIGVYTKNGFIEGDVLGWYVGEIVAPGSSDANNDYLMEMPIGFANTPASPYASDCDCDSLPPTPPSSCGSPRAGCIEGDVTVMIDASRKGNWTRFINHSCEPYTEFRMRRVGNMRIMVVEAIRDIPADVELSVSYGLDYYGPNTKKRCYCGSRKCVSVSRIAIRVDDVGAASKKKRVKKCSRLTPPPE
jgi:hypothetical protein